MGKILAETNLEALFGIEMDEGELLAGVDATWNSLKCGKCKGTGNFVGYSGRIVGKCFTCKGAGVLVGDADDNSKPINVSKIAEAFATAFGNGIKSPKLRLGTFMFSRAPDHGKNAGSIYVKDGEQYLGKVTAGQFIPVRECTDDQKSKVIEVAADPSSSAKAFGLRTGSCSCCGRTLTNGESIELGIGPGPICAENFGL